jgi:hypothetical protein
VIESVSRQQLQADRRPSCAIILSHIAFACFAISSFNTTPPDFSFLLQKKKKTKSSSMAAPGVEIAGVVSGTSFCMAKGE